MKRDSAQSAMAQKRQVKVADRNRPDLRARFIRSETQLFKHRFESDDKNEKAEFLKSLALNWVEVGPDEKRELEGGLRRCMGREEGFGGETFFKVCHIPERSEVNVERSERLCIVSCEGGERDLRLSLVGVRERYLRDGVQSAFEWRAVISR